MEESKEKCAILGCNLMAILSQSLLNYTVKQPTLVAFLKHWLPESSLNARTFAYTVVESWTAFAFVGSLSPRFLAERLTLKITPT